MSDKIDQSDVQIIEVDEVFKQPFTFEQAQAIKQIYVKVTDSYAKQKDTTEVSVWLEQELKSNLPEKSDTQIKEISQDIMTTLEHCEQSKAALQKANSQGRSSQSWFASDLIKATSNMQVEQTKEFLLTIDQSLTKSNEELYNLVYNQSGDVNMNPNLDGYIAEQYHVNVFNENAALNGSKYRAEVCKPDGAYGKNSVDVVIKDTETGKIERRYQFKYCKDAKSTEKAFEHGDYRGQSKLVPEGQSADISKKSAEVIEAPDGTKSKPLSKEKAKSMQEELQEEGKLNEHDWNDFDNKELAKVIAQKAGTAALVGMGVGAGSYIVEKISNDEEIEAKELAKVAIKGGATSGLKVAASAAIKIAEEKEIIKLPSLNNFQKLTDGKFTGTTVPLPPKVTNTICATTGFLSIENAVALGKVASGELTLREGTDLIAENTMAAAAGAKGAVLGGALGAKAGAVIATAAASVISAPVAAAIVTASTVIGQVTGSMAGSKIGRGIAKVAKTAQKKVTEAVKSLGSSIISGVKSVVSSARSAISSAWSALTSWW